jgi:HEPN domain-containing protein
LGGAFIVLDKVQYWLELCDDNLITAKWLLEGKRYLDMAFFCHQITEKALKAVVASISEEAPPKIHDLKKLAKLGKILDNFSEEQLAFLVELDPFNIEARYPDYKANIAKTLTLEKCERIIKETEGFLCWIKQQLEK